VLEDIDEPADQVPQPADGALAYLAEHGLEPGECLLDRIEVRAVWQEEVQSCAGRFDPLFHCRPLVAREVVHDDHVTGLQLGNQNLRHKGFEPVAGDRPVEHHRCHHARHAQSRDQRSGLAVAVGEAHPQQLAFPAATVAAGHVSGSPGLVDEYEALGFDVDLAVEPMPTLPQDVGEILLVRVPGLFCA